jgi:hypothetical protein
MTVSELMQALADCDSLTDEVQLVTLDAVHGIHSVEVEKGMVFIQSDEEYYDGST